MTDTQIGLLSPEDAQRKKPASIYDVLAPIYDERYDDSHCAECGEENIHAWRTVIHGRRQLGPTLDLGCGTGLALDMGGIPTRNDYYTGVDPSVMMLRRLRTKHLWAQELYATTAEEFLLTLAPTQQASHLWQARRWDTVLSLFGSPSYIHAETIEKLPWFCYGRIVLMHYKDGYFPDYYDGSDELHTPPATANESREAAAGLAGADVWVHNNMQITVVDCAR